MERNAVLGYSYALAGALAYGAAQVLTRSGVSGDASISPLVAALLSMFFGMLALGFMNLKEVTTAARFQRAAVFWVALSGISSSIGVLSMYWALSYVPVMIAAPIANVNPLITLVLAHLFLGQHEKVTRRVVVGAVLVVAGVILVTVGRSF